MSCPLSPSPLRRHCRRLRRIVPSRAASPWLAFAVSLRLKPLDNLPSDSGIPNCTLMILRARRAHGVERPFADLSPSGECRDVGKRIGAIRAISRSLSIRPKIPLLNSLASRDRAQTDVSHDVSKPSDRMDRRIPFLSILLAESSSSVRFLLFFSFLAKSFPILR